MPLSSYYAICELLMRYGIDPEIARAVSINELRNFELQELSAIFKRVRRPSHDYCLFRTSLSAVPPPQSVKDVKFSLDEWWPSLWAPSVSFISPPRHMMEQSIKEGAALCINAKGQWSLRTSGYVTLSHVWAEGIQRDASHDGLMKSKLALIFDVLGKAGVNTEWIWTDVLAIPGGTAATTTLADEMLRINVINLMPIIYSKAETVIIFDALLLQLHPESPLDVAMALVCGKWATRVWTFQEIKLADKALVITAKGAYLFGDISEYLGRQVVTDSSRFYKLHQWFRLLQKSEEVRLTIPDLVFACRTRSSGVDIDYARAFFPTLNLTWEHGMTREEGMQRIFQSQQMHSTRIVTFFGAPRLRLNPGWAPSSFAGLEGTITNPLSWERRGLRAEWYAARIKEVMHTFSKYGKFVFNVKIEGQDRSLIQLVLAPNEGPNVIKNINRAISDGRCYIVSSESSQSAKGAEWARNVLITEKATTTEYDGFEVEVHCAAMVPTSEEYDEAKLPILIRHGNPAVDNNLFNELHYLWNSQELTSRPSDVPRQEGESQLHAAVRSGRIDDVKALLDAGELTATYDAQGWTPLHIASARNLAGVLKLLLSTDLNIEIRGQQLSKDSPLSIAAEHGSAAAIQILLAHGANLNARNDCDYTPIMVAANAHHTEAVAALLAGGADPNCRDKSGFSGSPLMLACGPGSKDILPLLEVLIEAGAEVNPTFHPLNWTPLRHAVEFHSEAVVAFLLEKGANVNTMEKGSNHTPLHTALVRRSESIARLLINAGVDCHTVFQGGLTPLHLAVETRNYTILQMILEKEPDVNARLDPAGSTPLHLAVARRQIMMVKILIEAAGTDVNARDRDGKSPLDLAIEQGEKDLMSIISSAMSSR